MQTRPNHRPWMRSIFPVLSLTKMSNAVNFQEDWLADTTFRELMRGSSPPGAPASVLVLVLAEWLDRGPCHWETDGLSSRSDLVR
ncbi:hypothetical protein RRG08_061148 [Elysia crispata]|uniref:Uncharacterized protein n=1 Tax=Elysia crispata TaxID=231223 RepID=A0AAE0XDH7_9GAST|nr:hypothetical protein RRG08_061148 [Elysia crispata]